VLCFPARAREFLFSKLSRPVLRPMQAIGSGYRGTVSSEKKRSALEAGNSPPYKAEFKHKLRYAKGSPPDAYMVCSGTGLGQNLACEK
jgi:hypothetical protein